MELSELTNEMHRFVEAKGWYSPDSPKPQTPRNIAISLSIEAAEILELYQWSEQPGDKEKITEELADLALYLLQLAHLTGIDLETAIFDKLQLNYDRDWPMS